MILVIVGTHLQSFERLVRAADELAARIEEPVIIQYGSSAYKPQFATGYEWVSQSQMVQLMTEARVILSHAGAGTIISALRLGKPIILVPRLKRFSENHNDHQLQLAFALQAQGKALALQDVSAELLQSALDELCGLKPMEHGATSLVSALSQQLHTWSDRA